MDPTLSLSFDDENKKSSMISKEDNVKKSVGFIFAFCLTYGSIVGSGIFISVKDTFNVFTSQPLGMVIVLWGLAGIISIFGGLCYAELGTRIPECGGERAYYKHILNDHFSKIFVFCSVFLIKPLVLAGLSVTTSKYIVSIWKQNEEDWAAQQLIAIVVLFVCLLNNAFSKILAMRLGLLFTILKTIAILIVCVCGIEALIMKGSSVWSEPFKLEGFNLESFGKCAISLFWTYESWNTVGLVAGDMKNAKRDLPLAIITGVSCVVVLYVFCIISYAAVLDYNTVKNSTTLATLLGTKKLKGGSVVLIILICCSAIGAANGTMFSTAQVGASAGHSGELPKLFSLVHRKQRTPIFSLVCLFIFATCYTFINLETTFNYCEFINWVFYFISFLCLWIIKIKTRKESQTGIFSVPYFVIVPIQIVCVGFVILSFINEPKGCSIFAGIGLLIFALGFIPYSYHDIGFIKRFENKIITLSSRIGLELASIKDFS